jgi:hypothetical protein
LAIGMHANQQLVHLLHYTRVRSRFVGLGIQVSNEAYFYMLMVRTEPWIFSSFWCYALRWRYMMWCCLWVCPTPGKLKSLLNRGRNRTRNLWFASSMLYQLSYEVLHPCIRR